MVDQRLQRVTELQARTGTCPPLLCPAERAILAQHRIVRIERILPALLILEILSVGAPHRECVRSARSFHAPQAGQRFGSIGTQRARLLEGTLGLIELTGSESREPLTRRFGV